MDGTHGIDDLTNGRFFQQVAPRPGVVARDPVEHAQVVETGSDVEVVGTQDLFADPQLEHRQYFRVLNHKVIGPHAYHAPAYRLSKTPCELWKAGPCLGEDNEYVLKTFLGYPDDEIADMLVDGTITTEADLPA